MMKIVELILSDEARVGRGTEQDPLRRISQLWTKDGKLVAEYDMHTQH